MALNDFAADIATADGAHEAFLFEEAARLLLPDAEREHIFRLRQWIDERAFAQAAICLHHHALPAYGFQIGEMPPGAAQKRGVASTWRRGEHRALPFTAATPGLALLRAAASAAARAAEASMQADCAFCRGVGWISGVGGSKAICRHGRQSDENSADRFPDPRGL
ncbi:MAG: hypothetical protein ACLQUZ_14610 [Rhizomicrobium sp.]